MSERFTVMEIVNFTPIPAFIGGMLIGLAAAWLFLFQGRIAGVSGILGGLLVPNESGIGWRVLFLVGLILGGLLYQLLGFEPALTEITAQTNTIGLILGGLLVGIGTTIGSGCTSGHGICGLSRGSIRSLVATLSFMGSALVTVFVIRHLLGGGA